MKSLLLISSAILLVACGGGGSDSAPTSPPVNNEPPTTTNAEPEQGVAALEVDAQFDFKTDVYVTLEVAENTVDARAFLNICQFDAVLTNEEECYLRAPLDSSGISTHFVLPHQAEQLKAEIWYYHTDRQPLRYRWQFDSAKEQQLWVIE